MTNQQTIAEIQAKFTPLLGKRYTLPITANKGLPGHFLEDLLGIPHTPNALDCSDGELKLFPVKKLKSGALVPKETIAVTMLSKDDLKTCDFNSSRVCKKLSKVLIVPYFREGDTIQFLEAWLIERTDPAFSQVYATLEADYNEIRRHFLETGALESKTGTFLQNRTKGPGHGSTTRAYFLRQQFMRQFVPLLKPTNEI